MLLYKPREFINLLPIGNVGHFSNLDLVLEARDLISKTCFSRVHHSKGTVTFVTDLKVQKSCNDLEPRTSLPKQSDGGVQTILNMHAHS